MIPVGLKTEFTADFSSSTTYIQVKVMFFRERPPPPMHLQFV